MSKSRWDRRDESHESHERDRSPRSPSPSRKKDHKNSSSSREDRERREYERDHNTKYDRHEDRYDDYKPRKESRFDRMPSPSQQPPPPPESKPKEGTKKEIFTFELEINDSPQRINLTKSSTLEELKRLTGGTILTKGTYRPPGAVALDRPLYLLITADSKVVLDTTLAKIDDILTGKLDPLLLAASHNTQTLHKTKVYVGIDNAPPSFNIVGKLLGPKGSYIKHIATASGAKVILRGPGVGVTNVQDIGQGDDDDKILHVFISSNNKANIEKAKGLADNLIDTVKKDYQEFLARGVARKKAMQAQQSNNNSVSPYAGYDPYITPYQQQQQQQQQQLYSNSYAYSYTQPMNYAQPYPTGYEGQWTGVQAPGYSGVEGQEGSFRSHL